jgi:predicted RNA-binding protein with PIN domain
MDIIIDGYNLIGSEQGLHGVLESKRNWLVQRISLYQKIKQFKVTVIFDGWRAGRPEQVGQKVDGVTVIYSRLDEKADAVIISLAREKGGGSVVVTSDREIRNAVERFGAVAIAANDFSKILRNMDMQSAEDELDEESYSGSKRGNPNRLSKLERRRQEKLKKLKI